MQESQAMEHGGPATHQHRPMCVADVDDAASGVWLKRPTFSRNVDAQ